MGIPALYAELYDRLSGAWQGLEDKPDENPETTLKALWHAAGGDPRTIARLGADLPRLNAAQEETLRGLVARRIGGAPLAYLTGRQSYLGIDLLAGPGAMIPRKETEILGQLALEKLHALTASRGHVRCLDLCTGSGNIPLALAANEPNCTVFGSDISEEAVRLARQNAVFLGLSARAAFTSGDLFAPFDRPENLASFDLITCNPPYISTAHIDEMAREIAAFEPRAAFDGGPFGVRVLVQLVREAPRFLKPGSWLCFEVGLGQGASAANLLKKIPAYTEIDCRTDEAGAVRAVAART